MKYFTKGKISKALSELTINLASGWIGILIISPGFFNVASSDYLKLILFNLPPAIISLTIGIYLMQND